MDKKQAILLIAAGAIFLMYSLGMNTTVESELGQIHNIGLVSDKNNYILISLGMIALGAIFFAKGNNSENRDTTSQHRGICPYCAEEIHVDAKICKHCKSEIKINPEDSSNSTANQTTKNKGAESKEKETTNSETKTPLKYLLILENHCKNILIHPKLQQFASTLENRKIIFIVPLAILFFYRAWFWTLQGFLWQGTILALSIYFIAKGKKPPTESCTAETSKLNHIDVDEYGKNLAIKLTLISAILLYFPSFYILYTRLSGTYLAALPVFLLLITCIHFHLTKNRKWKIATSVFLTIFIINIIHFLIISNTLSYAIQRIMSDELPPKLPINLCFSLLFLFLSTVFPKINYSKIFGYEISKLKFDFFIKAGDGHQISLPLHSSFVIGTIFAGIYMLLDQIVF